MPDIENMDDGQINMMKSMMQDQNSRAMMKQMMKSQYGMDVSEDQLNMMVNMMNKDTLKMASNQMKSGQRPNPIVRPQQSAFPQQQKSANPTTLDDSPHQTQPPNPPENMEEMMKNMQNGQQPNLDSLMENKEMIKMVFQMLKTNPAMIRAMTEQLGDANPVSKFLKNKSDDQLKKLAVWLERLMNGFMFCYPAIKVVKNNFKTLLVLLAAYIIYRCI